MTNAKKVTLDQCLAAAEKFTEADKRRLLELGRLQTIAELFGLSAVVDATAAEARSVVRSHLA